MAAAARAGTALALMAGGVRAFDSHPRDAGAASPVGAEKCLTTDGIECDFQFFGEQYTGCYDGDDDVAQGVPWCYTNGDGDWGWCDLDSSPYCMSDSDIPEENDGNGPHIECSGALNRIAEADGLGDDDTNLEAWAAQKRQQQSWADASDRIRATQIA